MPSVFLSHNSNDKPFARAIGNKLIEFGVEVWIDEAEIKIGDSLLKKISEAVDKIDFLIVILSENSINSKWVQLELEIVFMDELDKGRPIILPVLKQKIELPPKLNFIKNKRYCDLSNSEIYEKEFSILLKTLGISTGVSASLSNLELFDFLDIARDEKEIYILAKQNCGNGLFFTDPEGAKKFESYVYLIKISIDGNVASSLISSNLAVSHGAIKIIDDTVCTFFNYKILQGTFDMSGNFTYFSKNLRKLGTKAVFVNKNWGWFPIILDRNTIEHFSFSNYHKCINDTQVEDRNFTADDIIAKQSESRKLHSLGWLPNNNDTIVELIKKWVSLD